jgi:hypothetical protein
MDHSREEELAELADELADEAYVSGRRPFPRPLSAGDAADLALALCAQVDAAAAARGRMAARQGLRVVCDRGCNGCCEEMIVVFQPEAQAAARWLARPENAAARDRFLAAYAGWREAAGDAPERLADLVAKGDDRGYLAAHQAQWRRRLLCAFNHEGDCLIYPARPMTCRNAHADETPARCSAASAGPPASRLAFAPLDEYLRGADRVMQGAHHALGGPRRRPSALCVAVYEILMEPAGTGGHTG